MMKTWSKQQIITYIILLILFAMDFAQSLLVLAYDELLSSSIKKIYANQFEIWITLLYWSVLLGVPLLALIIKLNRAQLHRLNIDRFYVGILMAAGLLLLYPLPYNCFAVITVIYLIYILFDNKAVFGVLNSVTLWMILLIVSISAGIMLFVMSFAQSATIHLWSTEQSLRHFLLEIIPVSIFEEGLYRGALYMFLKDLGFSESKVFYTSAFLFWIKHINYILIAPISFWVALPILSLALGYIVLRSKSLTASTSAHVLYNAFAEFVFFA